MVNKNTKGEIAEIQTVSQFYPGKSQAECGPYAVAMNKYAVEANHQLVVAPGSIESYADALYDSVFGSNTIQQENGVIPNTIHTWLIQAGLHYQDLITITDGSNQINDLDYIKAALALGYTVLAEIKEDSVIDVELNGSPYNWNTSSFWHYITYTGYTANGDLLVHDAANVTGVLNGNNTPRPQPRTYKASAINNRWCTMVWHNWNTMIPSGFDPIKDKLPVASPPPTNNVKWTQELIDNWKSADNGISNNTGIANAWLHLMSGGQHHFGPPVTHEYNTVLPDGKTPIIAQNFQYARCEYHNGISSFYDARGFVASFK